MNKAQLHKNIRRVLLFLSLLVFLYSSYKIFVYYREDANAKLVRQIDELPEKNKDEQNALPTQNDNVQPLTEQQIDVQNFNQNLDRMQAINADIKGRIVIPKAEIDYPFVQGTDNDYYLEHDVEKKEYPGGSIFADYENNLDQLPDNLVLYGHHMRSAKMFHNLERYKEKSFFDQKPMIEIKIRDEIAYYQVIAVSIMNLEDENMLFLFNHHLTWGDNMNARIYLQAFHNSILYQNSEELEENSKLLTLSTCSYEYANARLVLIAKQQPEMGKQ